MTKAQLIDMVIKQIMRDIDNHDQTAIAELLSYVPEHYLKGFLSEGSV